MHRILWGKHRALIQFVSLLSIFTFTSGVFAASAQFASVIPSGKVTVYDKGQRVGELTAEAPLPEGKLLQTQGKCGVKMDSLYLVATDKSTFGVKTKDTDKMLAVKNGRVYFAISSMPGALEFTTPLGEILVKQVMINASADTNLLKGYIQVSDEQAEIGVIEGGSMIIATADGEKKITSGNRMLLAASNLGATGGAASGATEGATASWLPWAIGGGLLVLITGGLILGNNTGDGDTFVPTGPGTGSPTTP